MAACNAIVVVKVVLSNSTVMNIELTTKQPFIYSWFAMNSILKVQGLSKANDQIKDIIKKRHNFKQFGLAFIIVFTISTYLLNTI